MKKKYKILLVISGGISAYKSLELIRIIKNDGNEVKTILTSGGEKFVTPLSIAAISNEKVYQEIFSLKDESEMGHIQLSRESDVIIVAPASANIIAKSANGIADDLASTVLLASNKPVIFAPAMNSLMWHNPATQRNIESLKKDNINFIGPEPGDLACGEEGLGRMSEPKDIYKYILSILKNKKKNYNIKALVTAGPTYEPIDPVRFIGNRSSGKQGIAIANQLDDLGLHVTLVTGPTHQQISNNINTIRVNTATEMLNACRDSLPVDVAVCAAAVCDWTIMSPSKNKIKKHANQKPEIDLTLAPDILDNISNAGNQRPKLVVGFAAETNNLITNAKKKLVQKNCDWIIANNVLDNPDIFGGEDNKINLISKSCIEEWPKKSKDEIAKLLSIKILEALS